jgi:hypothetical protein
MVNSGKGEPMKAFIHHLINEQGVTDPNELGVPPVGTDVLVGELTLLPGAWVIYAKGSITNLAPQIAPVTCRLSMQSVTVVDDFYRDTLGKDQIACFTLCIGVHLTERKNAQLFVRNNGFPFIVSNITLSAIQVDTVQVAREHETALAPGSSPTAQIS